MENPKTLFEKIIEGEVPGEIVYEDGKCFILNDINPQAPTHCLVIPRKPIPHLDAASDEDMELLGYLLLVARDHAKKLGIQEGYRIVINNGKMAGETVPHLHVHLLGGRAMTWPPG